MRLIGLTGSIGTGKSTVSKMLSERGIEVIDADAISRRISEVGNEGYNKIVELFGKGVLGDDKSLDRKKIGSIVFSNRAELKRLNDAMHPIIVREIEKRVKELDMDGHDIAVLDAPLLIETGLNESVDFVLLIVCSEEIQLDRIQKRDGLDRKQAEGRIRNQMEQDAKREYADYVIDNSKDIHSLEDEVEKFLEYYGGFGS
ncbi:dephospho-CoA kinase [Peptoclostridium litorale DSM 5388]|uniref:Dephospho-CoA kinase n=2 Tax=Peptoclostridium litorale TaxID=1557 RepID=A0A069RFR8_PEPLI|nr:dephospho-CoA kinase [Peptoclostridium litorale]KDR95040.1 dephospho-CoA kinase CoaE [Peptoclostridium litorale DSM 5388]SIN76029.1 dephospho-CoA kinase [Peptoclostridium litorale DSM 5388]